MLTAFLGAMTFVIALTMVHSELSQRSGLSSGTIMRMSVLLAGVACIIAVTLVQMTI